MSGREFVLTQARWGPLIIVTFHHFAEELVRIRNNTNAAPHTKAAEPATTDGHSRLWELELLSPAADRPPRAFALPVFFCVDVPQLPRALLACVPVAAEADLCSVEPVVVEALAVSPWLELPAVPL